MGFNNNNKHVFDKMQQNESRFSLSYVGKMKLDKHSKGSISYPWY